MRKKSVAMAAILLAALGISCACGKVPEGPTEQEKDPPDRQEEHDKDDPVGEPEKGPRYTIDEASIGSDANGTAFSAAETEEHASPLKGKLLYWLGSSVTYGHASQGEAMAEYLAALTGCVCKKEAVSGTTLFDNGSGSYTRRMENGAVFSADERPDLFICQISTNDCLNDRLSKRGTVSDSLPQTLADCDRNTTLGAVEYIIKYVSDTWGCPVYFYSGAYFGDSGSRANADPRGSEYGKLVAQVRQIAEKWQIFDYDVRVIDLYNDEAFNAAASDDYYLWCMQDPIHPKKAGYLTWWTPYFEWFLEDALTE